MRKAAEGRAQIAHVATVKEHQGFLGSQRDLDEVSAGYGTVTVP
jgi:hypothetical protein